MRSAYICVTIGCVCLLINGGARSMFDTRYGVFENVTNAIDMFCGELTCLQLYVVVWARERMF